MSKRSVLILGALAIALLAVILVFEKGSLTSSELEERKGRLLERFVRERVQRIEIQRQGKRIVIVHEPAKEVPEGELQVEGEKWKLSEPVQAATDDDAIQSLLGALEWTDAVSTFENVTSSDRQRYGLDTPRIRAWFTAGRDRVAIVIGKPDTRDRGYYAQVGDDLSRAYIVPKDFLDALNHDASHFRTKKLVDFVDIFGVRSITLNGTELRKEGETWWLHTRGGRDRANGAAAEDMLRVLDEGRAERFVSEDADLARFGLDRPEIDVQFAFADDETLPDGGTRESRKVTRVRVGRPCDGHSEERTVLVDDRGPVLCVLSSALDAFRKELDALRLRKLVSVNSDDVSRLELRRGEDLLVLAKNDEAWTVQKNGRDALPADATAVSELLDALNELEAGSFETSSLEPARVTILEIKNANGTVIEHVAVSDSEGTSFRAQRQGDSSSMVFDAASREHFSTWEGRFAQRQLLHEPDERVKWFEIAHDGATPERVELVGDEWRVTEPRAAQADRNLARQVVRLAATLTAVRFVNVDIAPKITLRVRFSGGEDPERTLVLRVGDRGTEETLASDGTRTFVLQRDLVDAVYSPTFVKPATEEAPDQAE